MEESFLGTSSCRSPQHTSATGTHRVAQVPLQFCAVQACMNHWHARAMCSRSEQSTANDATFAKMDTHWQSSRAIPLSHERGGRHVRGTCLKERAFELYTVQPVLIKRSAQWRKAFWALPAVNLHSKQVVPLRSKPRLLPPPDLGREKCRSESAACHHILKMEHSLAIIQSNPIQSETWRPNNRQHQFGEPVCSA